MATLCAFAASLCLVAIALPAVPGATELPASALLEKAAQPAALLAIDEHEHDATLTARIFRGRLRGALSRLREGGRRVLGVERRQNRRDMRQERRLSRAGFGC